MSVLYLVVLLASIGCMVLLDRRFSLFFWRDARRAGLVVFSGLLFFVLWDLLGIGLGIFYRGETEFMTGVVVAPELPVEELFFLAFLSYLTMVLLTGADALLRARAGRR
ncbi:MAG TPA: lycopene cyclase domain-containing protein [Mycetocola sp.]|jgi:lycopene cyclase domain-containing protein|uniref:lycopene cyclase domain-containing protein n=1 Tax=Mycetocola sp. TaxID=1871042 RepID=UPI00262584C4|nr:lycopene cyclase domain-containing protein [Mycetocola sp.]MCU1560246.1 lycopene cyclase protein [Mycetocola sp.]HEV7849035.1 lycopene cyclase domain-containing protein [Mycetocola sp.]